MGIPFWYFCWLLDEFTLAFFSSAGLVHQLLRQNILLFCFLDAQTSSTIIGVLQLSAVLCWVGRVHSVCLRVFAANYDGEVGERQKIS